MRSDRSPVIEQVVAVMIAGGEKDGDSLEERAKDLAFEPAPPSRVVSAPSKNWSHFGKAVECVNADTAAPSAQLFICA